MVKFSKICTPPTIRYIRVHILDGCHGHVRGKGLLNLIQIISHFNTLVKNTYFGSNLKKELRYYWSILYWPCSKNNDRLMNTKNYWKFDILADLFITFKGNLSFYGISKVFNSNCEVGLFPKFKCVHFVTKLYRGSNFLSQNL